MSSSWNDEASQTTVVSGEIVPASVDAAVPTLPTTATGSAAVRWTWPIHSVVVVLPLVPVTATNSFETNRQASSSSPMTGTPRALAATIAGACLGYAGALDERPGAGGNNTA